MKLKTFSLLAILLACTASVSYGLGGWSPPNAAPSASAGADQTVSEGSTVTLDASGSMDPEGTIASYLWTQTAGPSVTLSNVAAIRPEFVAPEVSTDDTALSFQVTVTDQAGAQSSDSCIVSVSFVNAVPVADAGAFQTVAEGSTVTLSAAKSTDPDGNIKSYLWTQMAGTPVTLSSNSAISPTFTAPDVGVDGMALTFRVTVTDLGGLQSSDACIVNVSFVNEAPVADAGDTQIVEEGSTATLSASNSTDPDGNIKSYLWEQTAGPSVKLSDTSVINPDFIAPDVGVEGVVLSFRLTVTDQDGLQSSDTCSVKVSFINKGPVAEAGDAQTVEEGSTVTLSAANSTDPDDGIQSYLWTQVAGPSVTLSNPSDVSPTFIAPGVGSEGIALTFRVTVTDQGGLQSSDACLVNVTFVNAAPVAEAGETQIVSEGDTVTLSAANSTDQDDNIESYLWTQTGGPSVKLSDTSAVNPTFVAPEVGIEGMSLTFQLTVTDQGGLQSTDTSTVNVTFISAPPVAEAGASQATTEGTVVTLNAGDSTDPDDGIASYLWTQIGEPRVALSDASAVNPTFTAPVAGTEGVSLVFQVTVTDQGGLQSSDTCTVTVSASQSTNVSLQWDTNDDADYYIVYWGETSKNYTFNSDNINSPTTAYTVTGLDKKTYYFAVKAFNACGNSSDFSTEITYNLSGANAAPVADAGSDQSAPKGANVSLDGTNSTDTDDGIQSYLWTQTSGTSVALSNASSESATFTAPDVGVAGESLTFQLTVTDLGGLQSTDTCTVNITFVNEAPVAEAGGTQVVEEGATVTLNAANSTDPDDGIKSYLWEQIAGPSVVLSSTSAVRPTFVAPDVGVEGTALTFKVTVTDQGGLQSSDTSIVNVSFVNTAPVAEAGEAQTVTEGSTVTLSAANSTDPDDGIQSYLWTQVAGPAVTLSNPSDVSPTFIAPDVGSEGIALTFRVTVTDQAGLQSSDSSIVNVTFINTMPVADAGANQTVAEGATVTLSAANSNDPDDGIASYLWTQAGEPRVVLSDASAVNPTFTAPEAGTGGVSLAFQVTVTDQGGLQSSDTCTVTVPTSQGTNVTLQWDTNDDADYYIVYWGESSKNYTFNSDNINSPTTTYTVTGLDQKTYYFAVKAFNACGNSSDFSTEITYNLSGPNVAPVAVAGADQSVMKGASVSLNGANSTDPDDGIKSYLWTQTSGASVTLSNASSANATFIAPDVGDTGASFTFQLTVTDYGGIQSSDTCVVSVSGTPSVGEVALQWDTNADADYYVVYWGDTSKNYTSNSDNINSPTTTYKVAGLDKKTYYFAVKAFNACGNSSDFSTEISYDLSGVTTFSTGTTPDTGTGVVQSIPGGITMDGKISAVVETPVEPVSPDSLISILSNNPSIELLDTGFQHMEWLQIGWAEYNSVSGEARIATGDIDGDGEDEIIIGLGNVPDNPEIPGGFFQILDHDFTHLAWGHVNWPEYNAINGETWPACGDLDGDGDDEIIIGLGRGGEGTIEIFDYDSSGLFHIEWVASGWDEYNSLIGETRPASGDIDGDGFDEVVVGLAPEAENFAIPNGYFEIIESNFTHASWGEVDWPEYNTVNGETWPACGDIFGNGYDEIITGLGFGGNGQVEIFEYQGTEVAHSAWLQVDWTEYNTVNGETRPGVADIDNDGKNEIIVGLGPVDENDSIPGGRFQVTDDDYSILEWLEIGWPDYNTVSGATRPVGGVINDSEIILMGLGNK